MRIFFGKLLQKRVGAITSGLQMGEVGHLLCLCSVFSVAVLYSVLVTRVFKCWLFFNENALQIKYNYLNSFIGVETAGEYHHKYHFCEERKTQVQQIFELQICSFCYHLQQFS